MGITAWRASAVTAGLICLLMTSVQARAQASDATVQYVVDSKYFDSNDNPTYRIAADGNVDWYTSAGYTGYHQICRGCHGLRGQGSDYGASLTEAVASISYSDFVDAVTNGQIGRATGAARIMPAFGTNPQVMCRLDAIYVYLRAESDGAIRRSPPAVSNDVNDVPQVQLQSCLGE